MEMFSASLDLCRNRLSANMGAFRTDSKPKAHTELRSSATGIRGRRTPRTSEIVAGKCELGAETALKRWVERKPTDSG